jgi:PKHD-type hydroxylase
MIWQLDLLNADQIQYLKSHYTQEQFESGVKSNPNTNLKNNLMMKDNHQYKLLHDYFVRHLWSCEKLSSIFIANKFSQNYFLWYKEGMKYDYHIDNYPIAGVNADLSMTVFLSEPDEYEGGELVIKVGDVETFHKPKAGTAIIYNTGLWHKINRVISGERKVVVGWIESKVKNSFIRDHVINYGLTIEEMSDTICFDYLQKLEQFRINLIREYGSN